MSNNNIFTYRNISTETQTIIGVGIVEAGESITLYAPLSNPNFELVDDLKTISNKQAKIASKE